MTKDGKGECVGGIAMMLKGANANVVTQELEKRVEKIQKLLPEGVSIEPYLNRSELVNRNISTVVHNLIEGAIIVFVVLIIFLGNIRAGLIRSFSHSAGYAVRIHPYAYFRSDSQPDEPRRY